MVRHIFVVALAEQTCGAYVFVNRNTIADGRMIHSFRYAVTEAAHLALDISDVAEIVIRKGEPILTKIHSDQSVEYVHLPNEEVSDRFVNTLVRRNPDIKISR